MDTQTRKAALVTGASSGIGAEFARQLAAQGYDLILVARRKHRLQILAREIQQCHGVRVEIVVADLSHLTGIKQVERRLAAYSPLEYLVNSAGFGTAGKFSEADFGRQLDMISLHVIACVRLCRAALPGMIDAGHGTIINVSSPAAFIPGPGNVTYSATKAYINVFSKGLAAELAGTGVKMQVLSPGFTITGFHDTPEYRQLAIRSRLPKALWMGADQVVSASLKALKHNRTFCIPGLQNRLMIGLARIGLGDLLSATLTRLFPALTHQLVVPTESQGARNI